MTPFPLRPLGRALLAACVLSTLAAQAQATPTNANATTVASAPVTLNFVNAEIEAVARTLAVITGRNVVVDPRVKGTLNLASETPITPAAAWDQFLAGLRLQGYAVAESAGIYKVVPEAEAKIQSTSVNAGPASQVRGNVIVTQIFPLNHENASSLVPVLRPLISPNNTINANGNTLVITDYADNLQRIARIIAALDVSNAGDIDIVPLRYAIATDLAALVNRLIEGGAATASGTSGGGKTSDAAADAAATGSDGYRTAVLADPRSNSLVLRTANPARAALVRSLVARLDRPSAEVDSGNIHVVYLRHADATQLAVTLRAAIAADPGFSGSSTTGGATGAATAVASTGAATQQGLTAATSSTSSSSTTSSVSSTSTSSSATTSNLLSSSVQPSTGGQIQADPANNALIISAPAPLYRQMRAVIDQLDLRRAQIYLEALIAEVSDEDTGDLGVQWLGLAGAGNGYIGGGTNFGSTGNLWNNLAYAALDSYSSMSYSEGLNVGVYKGSLAVLASALETKTNANILSTPTLLTLDNQEAKITIGQNVPVATGSYTTSSSSSTTSPYTTYERMDVGLTLNIKPQINADGTVKLQIYQEVSSISGALSSSEDVDSSNLVTNKRTIASTVLVQDGSTAVLGGLIQDELDVSVSRVPVLGRLPYIGALFRSQSRSRTKTNLMVFLRPVILRDNPSMDRLALDRYDMMRSAQLQGQPEPSKVIPINSGPILPAVAPNGTPLSQGGAVPAPMVNVLKQPQPQPNPRKKPAASRQSELPDFMRREMP
ncbi:MAG: type II secretion system secretin GspD [Comamonas sp.]